MHVYSHEYTCIEILNIYMCIAWKWEKCMNSKRYGVAFVAQSNAE